MFRNIYYVKFKIIVVFEGIFGVGKSIIIIEVVRELKR